MTFRIAGQKVHLRTGVPHQVRLCATGSYRFAFSTHGYLGYRPVSARATFPTWVPTHSCQKSGTKRSTLEPLQPGVAAQAGRAP